MDIRPWHTQSYNRSSDNAAHRKCIKPHAADVKPHAAKHEKQNLCKSSHFAQIMDVRLPLSTPLINEEPTQDEDTILYLCSVLGFVGQ